MPKCLLLFFADVCLFVCHCVVLCIFYFSCVRFKDTHTHTLGCCARVSLKSFLRRWLGRASKKGGGGSGGNSLHLSPSPSLCSPRRRRTIGHLFQKQHVFVTKHKSNCNNLKKFSLFVCINFFGSPNCPLRDREY